MLGERFILILFLFLGLSFNVFSQKENFNFKEGDLLFQDLDCGDLCTAIEKVTPGYNNFKFSHIGLLFKNKNGELLVIEAIGKGVCLTPIDSFMFRSIDKDYNPKVVVGRLKPEFSHLITKAIKKAIELLHYPYDDEFIINNKRYYCSELIYEAFKYANNGKDFFKLQPMTFKDPATGEFFATWIEYYKNLKKTIPEGKPGINPGLISISNKINILKIFGKINQ